MRSKLAIAVTGILLFSFGSSQLLGQTTGKNAKTDLMSNQDYAALLDRIDADLQKWEAMVTNVDPGKGDPSYKVGTEIAQNKELALLEVSNTRKYVERERLKRTVYGEIALGQFLTSLFDAIEELAWNGGLNDVSVATLKSHAHEISEMEKRLYEDGMRRLKILESGTCSQR